MKKGYSECILAFMIIVCVLFSGCGLNSGADNSEPDSSHNSSAESEGISEIQTFNFFGEDEEGTLLNASNLRRETKNVIVWSSNQNSTSSVFMFNKETGDLKKMVSSTAEGVNYFSFDNNILVYGIDDDEKDIEAYRLYVFDEEGKIIKQTTLPLNPYLCNDMVVYGNSLYYLKRDNIYVGWRDPKTFVKYDLNSGKEEILCNEVYVFGFYQDAVYLVDKHKIMEFDPETKKTSVVYENNEEDLSVGAFRDNYFFDYSVYYDSEGAYSEPGSNVVDLKTGKHYDILSSVAEENPGYRTVVFARDNDNFYFYFDTTFDGYANPYIVYSYNIESGEIKEHSRPDLKFTSNFKGETFEIKKGGDLIGHIGSKYYYFYENDIYFVDLLKPTK